jgi:hypothetical protein
MCCGFSGAAACTTRDRQVVDRAARRASSGWRDDPRVLTHGGIIIDSAPPNGHGEPRGPDDRDIAQYAHLCWSILIAVSWSAT